MQKIEMSIFVAMFYCFKNKYVWIIYASSRFRSDITAAVADSIIDKFQFESNSEFKSMLGEIIFPPSAYF